MNTRSISVGLLGGALAAFALSLPLHHILPAAYVPGWQAVPDYLGWIGYLFAALLAVLAAYSAARLSWATSLVKALKAGAFTGALVGLVAFLLVGVSTAGLIGSREILQYVGQAGGETINAVHLLAEAITRVVWYIYLMLVVFVAAGALLGMLGAGLHILQGGDTWLSEPQPFNSSIYLLASITLFLVSGMTYLILEVLLAAIPDIDQVSSFRILLWDRIHLPPVGVKLWPKAIILGGMLFTFWKVVAWITQWLRHPDEPVRKSIRLIAVLTAIFSLVVCVSLFVALPNVERFTILALLLVTGGGAIIVTRRADRTIAPLSQPFIDFPDLFQGFFLLPFFAAQVLVGGGVFIWQALQVNVIPFIPQLMGNAEAASIDLVANTNTYFDMHTATVVKAVLYAALAWALVIWPIGWLYARVVKARFFPNEEDPET